LFLAWEIGWPLEARSPSPLQRGLRWLRLNRASIMVHVRRQEMSVVKYKDGLLLSLKSPVFFSSIGSIFTITSTFFPPGLLASPNSFFLSLFLSLPAST
jgi:hypothetical protein